MCVAIPPPILSPPAILHIDNSRPDQRSLSRIDSRMSHSISPRTRLQIPSTQPCSTDCIPHRRAPLSTLSISIQSITSLTSRVLYPSLFATTPPQFHSIIRTSTIRNEQHHVPITIFPRLLIPCVHARLVIDCPARDLGTPSSTIGVRSRELRHTSSPNDATSTPFDRVRVVNPKFSESIRIPIKYSCNVP